MDPRPALVACLTLTPTVAAAATIVVSPGESIQAAIDQATVGDVIEVEHGVYNEALEINNLVGNDASWLVLRGVRSESGERPVLEAPAADFQDDGIIVWQSSYIRIEGLEVRNFHFDDGIRVSSGDFIEIVECEVHHNADDPSGVDAPGSEHLGSGIAVSDGTTGILIARNSVHHNGASTSFDHGMYLRGTGHRVENNLVYSNSGFGIQLYPHAEQFVVANNVVAFHPVKSGMILYSDECHDNHVFNNLGWHNAQRTVTVGGGATGNLIETNMGFGDGDGVADDEPGNTYDNNIDADPLFVDADGFEFELREGSPAIGAGLVPDAPTDDYRGLPRPEGGPISLGAYEFLVEPPGGTDSGSDGSGSGEGGSTGADGGTSGATGGDDAGGTGTGGGDGGQSDSDAGCACVAGERRGYGGAAFVVLVVVLGRRRVGRGSGTGTGTGTERASPAG